MSKYDPLWHYLKSHQKSGYQLSFGEIEKILGFKIDHSFLTYKRELSDYGYEVGKISLKDKTVSFNKIDKVHDKTST